MREVHAFLLPDVAHRLAIAKWEREEGKGVINSSLRPEPSSGLKGREQLKEEGVSER